MIRFVLLTSLVYFLAGCSFQSPPNEWQYKSSNAFESYTKSFLQDKQLLAKNDLVRAQEHARMSADLTMLARVYLGKCALNRAVGIEDSCQEYLELHSLVEDRSLRSYYALLQKEMTQESIAHLPKRYHDFAYAHTSKEYNKAFESILSMEPISSQLIAASLLGEHLTLEQKEKILTLSSFYGYKKASLFWLEQIKATTQDAKMIEQIEKKITILKKGIQ
ncbi:MAG: hypothetical protein RBR54_07975 [Sulfurimonas sp.]|jgi:hypothetical protein|nr:hypothetical protein [Sulfurimonas sp.]